MPTQKPRGHPLTLDLLSQYRDAALANSNELLQEAAILLGARHTARAYFLAVASIEETGKAVLAHDGMGRNLANPAVRTKLQSLFADHSNKVTSAFTPWLLALPDLREQAMDFVRTMIDLKHGREPSMYVDFSTDATSIVRPVDVVPEKTADNCVALATQVLARAKARVASIPPSQTTPAQDAFFAMSQKVVTAVMNTSDFWDYFLHKAERGDKALENAFTEYHDKYSTKSKSFKAQE